MNAASKRLSGKVALVTGGTGGVGLATAQRLVAEGAELFITGRHQEELDAAIKMTGRKVVGVLGTMSNLADLDELYAAIRKKKGRLDILFANAGCEEAQPLPEIVPMEQVSEAHFDKCFGANVKGTLFSVQKALPLMSAGGAIVINGSLVSLKGLPAFGLYAATKAALRSFARTWALALRERGIRVNLVSPGPPTPYGIHPDLGLGEEQMERYLMETAGSHRTGTLDETAKAVVFLCSEESSLVTGIELFVAGGIAQL